MALEKTPQLKTVIPVDAMANLGYASMRNGGAFELRFWNWIMLNSARGSRASMFKKGHRIRVDVSSSNFPRFDVNPNSGEPLNRHRRKVVATNTVYHDQSRASHIILPVIPQAGAQ